MPSFHCRNCKKPLEVSSKLQAIILGGLGSFAVGLGNVLGGIFGTAKSKKDEVGPVVIRCPHCDTMNSFEAP
jgi:hypothetical protein